MSRVRTAAVGNEVAFDRAVHQVDHVETRVAGRLREIDDADLVAVPDPMLVERRLGALE